MYVSFVLMDVMKHVMHQAPSSLDLALPSSSKHYYIGFPTPVVVSSQLLDLEPLPVEERESLTSLREDA